jgi:hypothetical protein
VEDIDAAVRTKPNTQTLDRLDTAQALATDLGTILTVPYNVQYSTAQHSTARAAQATAWPAAHSTP